MDAVIGGWQPSTIYIYRSGQPLSWQDVIFFGDPANIANGPRTAEQWFNVNAGLTKASSTRPSNHFRTRSMRFANVRGDALNHVDLSLNRSWHLKERGAVGQLRGETLNAFNHPTLGLPQMDQFNRAFGQISATLNYARQVQSMVRASF